MKKLALLALLLPLPALAVDFVDGKMPDPAKV